MPTFNTIINIESPPAGLLPWRWTYTAEGTINDFVRVQSAFIMGVPRMKNTGGVISPAVDSFNQEINPLNILDLFREATPPTPVPHLPGHTFFPVDGFLCARYDVNERDAALLFPSPVPGDGFTLKTTLQRLPSITLEVTWNVTRIDALETQNVDYYNLDATPSNPKWLDDSGNEIGPVPVERETYFNGDPVIISVVPQSTASRVMLEVYGEIVNQQTGFDVTIAGEGPILPTNTVDVRVRYHPMIQAGLLATIEGRQYTIVGSEIEERYRYMTLSLSAI